MHYGYIFLRKIDRPLLTDLWTGVVDISGLLTDNERLMVGKGYLILANSFFRETILPIRFLSKNCLPSFKISRMLYLNKPVWIYNFLME